MRKVKSILVFFTFFIPQMVRADIYAFVDERGIVNISNIAGGQFSKVLVKEASKSKASLNESNSAYDLLVSSAAKKSGVDRRLLHALIKVESNYNPDAVSSKGACGLMQVMPETARRYGVNNILDPEQNIQAGAQYFSDLLKLFDNNLELAVAAYNAGENAVIKSGSRIPNYPETHDYVAKVMTVYNDIKRSNLISERVD
jgi:soluble lytic murein transglycosylase-like protein